MIQEFFKMPLKKQALTKAKGMTMNYNSVKVFTREPERHQLMEVSFPSTQQYKDSAEGAQVNGY